ncbi:hypothetical protein B296_00015164 [Ensete ventricosum]|uniref:Uncharacterized protein n=1 Tax=Ensete ventricosum TaxID=4639 RepID=A0A426XX23_ENSVE|nr:hypothetical protein B296_00015164 [Ensete ventricosum]
MLPCRSGIVVEEPAISQRKFQPKIVNFGAVVLGDEDEEKRVSNLEKMAVNLIKFRRKIVAVFAIYDVDVEDDSRLMDLRLGGR